MDFRHDRLQRERLAFEAARHLRPGFVVVMKHRGGWHVLDDSTAFDHALRELEILEPGQLLVESP